MVRVSVLLFMAVISATYADLPLSFNCDPRTSGSCHKGDLVSTNVADCERDSSILTCDPINDYALSSVVDAPDVNKHGVNCVPVKSRGLPFACGSAYDTRCVCDKAVDYTKPKETIANQCRCQYYPAVGSNKEMQY